MTANFLRRNLIFLAAATAAIALGARAQEAPRLDWQVERAAAGQIQLTLSYRTEHHNSSDSHTAALADLPGLTEAQLASPNLETVRFRLPRDAGDFVCDGSARADHASGSCDFHANPAFATALRAHGIAAPAADDLFQLAYANIGTAYLDELSHQRYPAPAVEDLVRAGQHGVSLAFLRELGAAGYHGDSLAGLVRIRDHGVNSRYITALKDAGYPHLAMEDLVRARDHGVTGQYLASLSSAGYRDLPIGLVVQMRDHGVSAIFIARANDRAKEQGDPRLSAEDLVRLHDRGGLYAQARVSPQPPEPRDPRDR